MCTAYCRKLALATGWKPLKYAARGYTLLDRKRATIRVGGSHNRTDQPQGTSDETRIAYRDFYSACSMAPFGTSRYSLVRETKESNVKSTLVAVRNIVGTAGLVFAAYVIAGAMPDLRRYIRITRM